MGWLRDEVLRRADIVEVVSEYLPLKKRGANYWALSPFKPEKTPSFAVSPSKQIFKCFASGKGGDVIRFVMEMEGLSYSEALQKLAKKYDIQLPAEKEISYSSKEKQQYAAIYGEAARFYQMHLKNSPAEAYLRQRGVKEEVASTFQLGYAPAEGDSLAQYLIRLGYSEESLIKWGLCLRHEGSGKIYDRFRGRLIFPITDEQGTIIAFAGRLITEASSQPKYLNSPETPYYQKSEVLYGLAQAKSHLRKGGAALIVEGYMDVISLHQAQFPQAVATCGTALTPAHLERLRRYTRELIILYDSDEAGQAAAERAIEPALSTGFFVRIAQITSAKDPDEFLRKSDSQGLAQIIQQSVSWPIFLSERRKDSSTPSQRYELLQRLGQCLQAIPDPLMRRVYAEEIAEKLHIPLEFWENFERIETSDRANPPSSIRITAERELLRIVFSYPEVEYAGMPLWQYLQEELRHFNFSEPAAEKLRKVLCDWNEPFPPTLAILTERLPVEVQDWAAGLVLEKYSLSEHWHTWDDSSTQEDPVQIAETNLTLLHLDHLQRLLEENLHFIQSLPPESATYQEHLTLHQVLLHQRAELAHRQGLILPYRKAEHPTKRNSPTNIQEEDLSL
ncbi:MAG: DNA primase [Bacteroidia bacterium]|nr:DNA primase [Bacteroidia bacterium]MDW8134508.1 DNA primase [Bacteroidia bacterium]